MNIPVVYEDDWLLIVDKPAGLLTIPTPRNEKRTLTSILNDDLKDKGALYRLHPCHRLDRETSGLIIYAKGKSAQKKMMDEFKRHNIGKGYIAFVQGVLRHNYGEITNPIDRMHASTYFKVINRRRDFTIVEVSPKTGRKNQIRIHFKAIGHPLVGETRFAFRKDYKLKAKRVCLHANYLKFNHPITKKSLELRLELSNDLKDFIKINN